MKKTIQIAILSILFLGTAGCTEDNSNFNYTTTAEALKIANRMSINPVDPTRAAYIFKQDEPIVIEAEYTINDPELQEGDLTFNWWLGDQIVSEEKTLHVENLPAGMYSGLISILDNRYKQYYTSRFTFMVDPAYTEGWAILSEQADGAQLGYLHIDTGSEEGSYEFIADVYGNANGGARIELGTTEMSYHSYGMDNNAWGLSIVQPGEEGPLDLNPNDMSIWGKIRNNFIGDASSLRFKSINYKAAHVYAMTESGEIYIREEGTYNNNVVPHTGKFPTTPAYSPGGLKVTKWLDNNRVASGSGIFSQSFIVAYNEATEQSILFRNGKVIPFSDEFFSNQTEPHKDGPGWDGTREYPDITYPNPADLSDYNVIAFEQSGPDYTNFSSTPVIVAMILQSKSDGTYYLFSYALDAPEFDLALIDIDLELFYPLPDQFDPETMVHCGTLGGSVPNIYLTDRTNRELYYINIRNGTTRKVYTSTSDITAINPGEVGNAFFAGIYDTLFVVGTQTGDLSVLKMDATAMALGNAEVLYTTNPGVGKITAIEFLPNNWVSY